MRVYAYVYMTINHACAECCVYMELNVLITESSHLDTTESTRVSFYNNVQCYISRSDLHLQTGSKPSFKVCWRNSIVHVLKDLVLVHNSNSVLSVLLSTLISNYLSLI